MEASKQMEIRLIDLWDILKRCWILVVAVLVAFSVIALIFMNITHTPVYTATVSLWAFRNNESAGSDYQNQMSDYYNSMVGSQMINDYKILLTSNRVVSKVKDTYGTKMSNENMIRALSISHAEDTRVMYLSITTTNQEVSTKLANIWGDTFCDVVNNELMKGQEVIQMLDYATTPERASNPVSTLKAILVGVIGAILVYGGYFVRFLLDDKINTPTDVERFLDLHLLGAIPDKKQLMRRRGKYYAYNRSSGQKN